MIWILATEQRIDTNSTSHFDSIIDRDDANHRIVIKTKFITQCSGNTTTGIGQDPFAINIVCRTKCISGQRLGHFIVTQIIDRLCHYRYNIILIESRCTNGNHKGFLQRIVGILVCDLHWQYLRNIKG